MKAVAVTRPFGIVDRLPRARRAGPSLFERISAWRRVARSRRRLLELDDWILADLGLTREDATREAVRPFWDRGGATYR